MRQRYFTWPFIYWGKWANVKYLWVETVCEPNLKVKLESTGWQSGVSGLLFYSKNTDLSKCQHVCGSVSWHEQRSFLRVVDAQQNHLWRVWTPSIHNKTDCVQMEKIMTTVTLCRRGSPTKTTSRASNVIVTKVTKEPRVTTRQLKASLLMFMIPPSEEHWTTLVCMAGLQGESHCSSNRTLVLICSLLKITWTRQKTIA